METYLYRASNLKSTITFLALVSKRKSISGTRKKPRHFLRFIHNNNNQRMQLHSLCRVGMHCSTHQYKLPVNFSTKSTSGGSL